MAIFTLSYSDWVVVAEAIMRIILGLQGTKSTQGGAIDGFLRLLSSGVVHVCCYNFLWLTRIPNVLDLLSPCMRSNIQATIRGVVDVHVASGTSQYQIEAVEVFGDAHLSKVNSRQG